MKDIPERDREVLACLRNYIAKAIRHRRRILRSRLHFYGKDRLQCSLVPDCETTSAGWLKWCDIGKSVIFIMQML